MCCSVSEEVMVVAYWSLNISLRVTVVTVVYCAVKLLTLPSPKVPEASQIRCLLRVTVTFWGLKTAVQGDGRNRRMWGDLWALIFSRVSLAKANQNPTQAICERCTRTLQHIFSSVNSTKKHIDEMRKKSHLEVSKKLSPQT